VAIKPLFFTGISAITALGRGLQQNQDALTRRSPGLRPCDFEHTRLDTWIGRVAGLEQVSLPENLANYNCRNNRLAMTGLQQDNFIDAVERARQKYGTDRIGVFIGTSTSGVQQTEWAYRHRQQDSGKLPDSFHYRETQNNFSVADFVQRYLGLNGIALAVSTACSSSAKVFASAHHYIKAGLCDAAVVGGVDSLCLTTLYGFSSLELVSTQACRPGDQDRDGISIGEGAGFVLLESDPANNSESTVALLGYGESSDAYHMSSPHPEGLGASIAMQAALDTSGLGPQDIDYINLHGTATPANDLAEDKAVSKLFASSAPCSSTKGWTGHTLGAAGVIGVATGYICIQNNFIPGSLNTVNIDSGLTSNIIIENRNQPVERVLCNAFGFGGSNCCLVIGKVQ